jgi:hypothetical protein
MTPPKLIASGRVLTLACLSTKNRRSVPPAERFPSLDHAPVFCWIEARASSHKVSVVRCRHMRSCHRSRTHSLQALALMQEKRIASVGSRWVRIQRRPSSSDWPGSNGTSWGLPTAGRIDGLMSYGGNQSTMRYWPPFLLTRLICPFAPTIGFGRLYSYHLSVGTGSGSTTRNFR